MNHCILHPRRYACLLSRVQIRVKSLQAIIGCDAGLSRHDAMEAGEAGASYLAFTGDLDDQLDMIDWWAELFELPCIGTGVRDAVVAMECACAGADFVSLSIDHALPPSAVGTLVGACAAAVSVTEGAAP